MDLLGWICRVYLLDSFRVDSQIASVGEFEIGLQIVSRMYWDGFTDRI